MLSLRHIEMCIRDRSEPVICLFVVPEREIDDKVHIGLRLDCADTEDVPRVDDADAAQLHVISYELGGRPDERLAGDPADRDCVVRDEPVSALYELEGRLTLADAGVAHDEQTLAIDLYEYAVQRDSRGHGVAKPTYEVRHEG